MLSYKIFFAWQSQDKGVSSFLKKQLELTKKHINDINGFDIDIIMSPTQEKSGSPDIIESIWNQIKESDVFIGDLTHVCELDGKNQISNSNVMYEVGIADSFLGENRTILLCSKKSEISKLAFDINHKRISPFNISENNFYIKLSEWVILAIRNSLNQKSYIRYICKDIRKPLEIVYNNIFRMIYSGFSVYPSGFYDVTRETIFNKLKEGIFNVLQVKANYSTIITQLERSIKELYGLHNEKLTFLLIRVVSAIETFQFVNHKSRFSQFEATTECGDIMYQFFDENAFYLKDIAGFELDSNLYHRDNVMFLSCITPQAFPLFNIFDIDTVIEIYKSDCITHIEHNMTFGKMPHYKFATNANVDEYAKIILSIISAIHDLLDYLKLYPDVLVDGNKSGNTIMFSKMDFN